MFRDLYAEVSDQHLRVSDAERQSVTDRLSEHFAAGRLDQAEFDERVSQAMNAKTRGDLSGLFADLPDTGAPAVPAHIRRRRPPGPAGRAAGRRADCHRPRAVVDRRADAVARAPVRGRAGRNRPHRPPPPAPRPGPSDLIFVRTGRGVSPGTRRSGRRAGPSRARQAVRPAGAQAVSPNAYRTGSQPVTGSLSGRPVTGRAWTTQGGPPERSSTHSTSTGCP